jgi:hypothetical protein
MYFFGVSNVTGESGRYRITQAKQQTKYKMNHKGALAKSAAAFGFSFECCVVRTPKPPMVVNQEFFVWITRPGMNLPIFTGYITKEDWKNPGDLTDNDMRHEGTTDEELAETEGNPEVLCSGDYLDE